MPPALPDVSDLVLTSLLCFVDVAIYYAQLVSNFFVSKLC